MAFSNSTNSPHFETSAKPSAIFSSRNQQFKRRAPPRCKSSEPLDTPCCLRTPRNSSKTPARKNPPVCDRFIPVRKGVDHELNSYKLLESLGNSEATQTGGDDMKSDFQKHLEKQLLEKEYKILAFRTKPPKTGNVAGTLKTLYSMNKVTAPKKMSRHIPQNAERVLDAPELIDDYCKSRPLELQTISADGLELRGYLYARGNPRVIKILSLDLNLLDWNNDGVISIALGPSVYLWNAATGSVAHLFDMTENGDEGEYVSSLSYDKSGHILAVGNSRKEVQLWDMTQQKRVRTMTGHTGRVSSLSWNGPFLTSASLSGSVHHHDVRISTHCVTMIPAHYGEVCGLKWSPDGRHLATGSNDNIIKIWTGIDGISTTPLHCLTNHVAAIKALAWCPWQSSLLASGAGTADKCIKFWNVVTGQCLNSVVTESQVCGLLWSAEHRELISGHGFSQNQLSIWKYPTMTKVCELMGHTGRILHMCCSPDKTIVATLGADETLRLWHCFQLMRQRRFCMQRKEEEVLAVH